MRIADLKRAVEDVILRPEDNRISEISKRSTIAALDLCQLERVAESTAIGMGAEMRQRGSAATLTSFSCSGEMLASPSERSESTCSTSVTTSSGPFPTQPSLSMSTSLDTMVLRHSVSCRPSLGASRRSSRVLQHLSHSKRKRSNSVSSCMNKGMIGAPDAVSSGGVSCASTDGASALSLPPTARHTPFRFGDLDERQYTACTSSFPYQNPFTEASLCDSQERTSVMLSSLDERANVDCSNDVLKECSETTHNCYDALTTHSATYSLGSETISRVLLDEESVRNTASFSFMAYRQPNNVCDLDEQMDCD